MQRRHSEGAARRPKNPLKFEASQKAQFIKKQILVKKANAFFILPPPPPAFSLRSKAGGGGRRGQAPATPFWKTECRMRKTEFVKFAFFVNFTILLARHAGDSSLALRMTAVTECGKRKTENGICKIRFFVNLTIL